MRSGTTIFFLLLISSCSLLAQDILFSQFGQLPSYQNPALSSVFSGNTRVSSIYRNQWSSLTVDIPYRTIGLAADFKYRLFGEDHFAVNLQVLNDKVGLAEFSQTFGHVGFSYTKKLGRFGIKKSNGHFLSFGTQGGFGQNAVNWSGLWFGNQFNIPTETIEDQASSGESFIIANTGRTGYYLDLNAGLFYYFKWTRTNAFYLGVSGHHINQPNISILQESPSFSNSRYLYERKLALLLGANYGINRNWEIRPKMNGMLQGRLIQFNLGSNLVYHSAYEPGFKPKIGVFFRLVKADSGDEGENSRYKILFDSVSVLVGAEVNNFDIGLSYDFTISTISSLNSRRGAVELSVIYTSPFIESERDGMIAPKIW